MSLKERLNNDLKDTMRARDSKKLGTLRLITAAIKQIEVDERIEVDDARLLLILDKLVKQRKESIAQFQAASRDDLVAQEEYELSIITPYLPEPVSEAEINSLIEQTMNELSATKISDMGKIMAHIKPQLQGRADMAKVSAIIKSKLSQ
ncbi:GatB/YqeY domain-containing protein [Legionella sp. CNM-4043-24]|uniref:GatB/YqeY domain-containing protein n=1 Tax=Legionella sp. CNM-4043-24 TaxID=3421646 RepID=UPI00403A82F3